MTDDTAPRKIAPTLQTENVRRCFELSEDRARRDIADITESAPSDPTPPTEIACLGDAVVLLRLNFAFWTTACAAQRRQKIFAS